MYSLADGPASRPNSKKCRMIKSVAVQNLRIAVLLNPDHGDFQARIQANPALLCKTEVHWMAPLSDAQQRGIARAGLSAACENGPTAEQESQHLISCLRSIHATAARHVSVTPQHFKTLVAQTASVLTDRKQALNAQIEFLKVHSACLKAVEPHTQRAMTFLVTDIVMQEYARSQWQHSTV